MSSLTSNSFIDTSTPISSHSPISIQPPVEIGLSSSTVRSPVSQQVLIGQYTPSIKEEWFDAIVNNDITQVRHMIDRGVDPTMVSYVTPRKKERALNIAIELGLNEIVKELLSIPGIIIREDLGILIVDEDPALLNAIDSDNNEAIELLMNHPDIDVNHRITWYTGSLTPLQYSISEENDDTQFDVLYTDRIDKRNRSRALGLAAEKGNEYIVRRLLESNDDEIDINDEHSAPLVRAVRHNHPHIVDILLTRSDLDINQYKYGSTETALNIAIQDGNEYLVQKLLDNGADVN